MLSVAATCDYMAASDYNIIPLPASIEERDGYFEIDPKTTIGVAESLKDYGEFLSEILSTSTGYDIPVKVGDKKSSIYLELDPAFLKKAEAYALSVTPQRVMMKGYDDAGVMYAIQTFLQLLPPQVYSEKRVRNIDWKVPCVEIEDYPQRPWRAMMLDVARYYHSLDYVKHFIDMMSKYKFNKLQLHLTDDSGWRLESEKYPLLTEKGAYAGTQQDRLGGYYTREEMKDLIDYAAFRNVEIIPEIELPAHILSAIVAYPELSCRGEQLELPRQHFISQDLLCVGKDNSLKFIFDVLEETAELFPSPYINIGGDEAVYTRWEECVDCQALKQRENLKETKDLQGWLTDSVARHMKRLGKTVVGWEEIITRGDVSTPVTALIWHEPSDSAFVANTPHKAILTPATHTYLDFPESSTPGEVKAATWMPPISLEKAYSLPINDYSEGSSVEGIQGCLWSDQFIIGEILQNIEPIGENRSSAYIDYLAFPRMMALSEVGWTSSAARDWNDFRERSASHYPKLDYAGIGYRVPEPILAGKETAGADNVKILLKPAAENTVVRYTTDGSYPTRHSSIFPPEGLTVKEGTVVKASTEGTGSRMSLPLTIATAEPEEKE